MKKGVKVWVLLGVLTMVTSLCTPMVASADNDGWSEDIRLTADSARSYTPAIAVDSANNVHITWMDDRDGNKEIYYTKLDNSGSTLVDDTRLTTDSRWSWYPAIAVDTANNVHIIWSGGSSYGNYEIYYTKLDNNGNTLVDDTRLTTSADPWDLAIAVDTANNVHITWRDNRDGNYEIYYKKLDNDGTTLVDDIRLSPVDAAASFWPAIAVDTTNNVHIIWKDGWYWNGKIYYKKLDNSGNTLVDDTRLTTADSAWSDDPAIAVDTNNNVHITWFDYRDLEIYYTKLDNNGNTLVDDTRLTNSASSWDPAIAVDTTNNVHITWFDDRTWAIYYTKLDNSGNTLVDDTRLTTADSGSPAIAVDTTNNVHITWVDSRDGNYEIYYKNNFGGASPGNEPPNPPTTLQQFKSDSVTGIPVGGTTDERTVIFKGTVSDPDGDQVKLQVELRNLDEYGGQFDETQGGLKDSVLVESGSEAVASAIELIDEDYHWRARAVDEHGEKSEWKEFGDNDVAEADFIVNTGPPPVPNKMIKPIDGKIKYPQNAFRGYFIDSYDKSNNYKKVDPILDTLVFTEGFHEKIGEVTKDEDVYERYKMYHEGIDIYADTGTSVKTAASGRIRWVDNNPSGKAGKWVWIWHGDATKLDGSSEDKISTRYLHLDTIHPDILNHIESPTNFAGKVDIPITQGAEIGTVGNTGCPKVDPHLHLEVRQGDNLFIYKPYNTLPLNPCEFIDYQGYQIPPDKAIDFTAYCPVDLVITDPSGLIISKEINQLPTSAEYIEMKYEGTGEDDENLYDYDAVIVHERKVGRYLVTVVPEPEASPTDIYDLQVNTLDASIVLAEHVPIDDIPDQPYVIESTEEGIIDKTPQPEPIPEFSTIALLVAAIFGLFVLIRRRKHH